MWNLIESQDPDEGFWSECWACPGLAEQNGEDGAWEQHPPVWPASKEERTAEAAGDQTLGPHGPIFIPICVRCVSRGSPNTLELDDAVLR